MKVTVRALASIVLVLVGLTSCRSWRPSAPTTTRGATAPSTTAAPSTTTSAPAPTSVPTTVSASGGTPAPAGRRTKDAGTTVGSAAYPVPEGALVVSPNGKDGNPGTAAAPMRTLAGAVNRAKAGATIVLRAGSYHESVAVPPNKRLTIQSWPNEAVWLDGSVPVTGWTASGGKWQKDGWTAEFDASPTFTRGAKDNKAEHWGFINATRPMAAHPDQIWIGGVALRQVASAAEVGPGTFFHDRGADRLVVGTDPNGKEVRASALQRALMVRSADSVVRGIGVRRYAPSVPDMGAVTVETNGITVEQVAILDSATTAIFIRGADVKLRNLHVARNGLIGLHAKEADRLVAERMLVEQNNVEQFNMSPSAGGMKLGTTRNAVVRDSVFRANKGTGLWFDVSSYDMTIVGNDLRGNERHGIFLEISSKALVADNVIAGNHSNGIKVNNTSDVSLWNNTFAANRERSVYLVQDDRKPSANSPDRDDRRPFPDPAMTWRLGPVMLRNNIISGQSAADCLLCVEDLTKERTAEQIGVTSNADVFHRPNPSTPRWVVLWSKGGGKSATFESLGAFRSGTGQAATSRAVDGTALVDAEGRVTGTLPAASAAEPLPAAVATVVGRPAGTRAYGAFG